MQLSKTLSELPKGLSPSRTDGRCPEAGAMEVDWFFAVFPSRLHSLALGSIHA